jgi:hypothetical protein
MSELKIKSILEWVKSELDKNFYSTSSSIKLLKAGVPGNSGYRLGFESDSVIGIEISCWDTGILEFIAKNLITGDYYIDLWHFTPDDYRNKFYPVESVEALVPKVNELLGKLNQENPKIMSSIPNDIIG